MPKSKEAARKKKAAAPAKDEEAADSTVVVKKQKTSAKTSAPTKSETNEPNSFRRRFLQYDTQKFLAKVLQEKLPDLSSGKWSATAPVFLLSVRKGKADACLGKHTHKGKTFEVTKNTEKATATQFPLAASGQLVGLSTMAIKEHIPGVYYLCGSTLEGCTLSTKHALDVQWPVTVLHVEFNLLDRQRPVSKDDKKATGKPEEKPSKPKTAPPAAEKKKNA
eukprot:NODE_3618_length_945_cov_39.184152_g3323_i0.p1 GENE.NODE_3618_length_945_cov_39.184152_g3323_i0~~NODE_3618_length_945_cov_39.184152_g3323_i0.p1  ORF type:complete len:221 (-),score=49.05 NODE_3618_length_945_cov_39.184152_g3323_i0:218-880(-)